MKLRRGIYSLAGLIALLLVVYLTTYVIWSRCFAWQIDRHWAFYAPPRGLVNLDVVARYHAPGLTLDEGWQRLERGPGVWFRPCIVIDEALCGRRYLPTSDAAMCFN